MMATPNETITDAASRSLIIGITSEGGAVRASILRLTRFSAVFEVYSSDLVLRVSEALESFKIVDNERTVYSGRAVVRNLITTGAMLVCEASLDESAWRDVNLGNISSQGDGGTEEYDVFIKQWQKNYRVRSDYKVVIADLQSYLSELRLWLDQIELKIRSEPSESRLVLERKLAKELSGPVVQTMDAFIERFEEIAVVLPPELQPVHRAYLQRLLHPLVLCAPFAHRTFYKPLGYAGDYEVVDMMLRPPFEGGSLFAKIINVWLLGQLPAQGHRNRIDYLVRRLVQETLRVQGQGRTAQVFNLGCGPAVEIQQFLSDYKCAEHAHLTLLDFNEETLRHLRAVLDECIKGNDHLKNRVKLVKKSVNQVLKDSGKSISRAPSDQYDFVYCAGLFDYLSDQVCKRLMDIFYDMLAPGGLLLATNVADDMNSSRPFRYSMEYILDWNLIYRSGRQFAALAPEKALPENISVVAEDTGVNVFIEVRKPYHA